MSDQFTAKYQDLLEGKYDCNALSTLAPVDRFVINAYLPGCATGGGFRNWWRLLYGSDDNLDDTHLMRMAGHFSRRLRGFAKANHIPVIDCLAGDQKHQTAEEYLSSHTPPPGLFMVLVGRAPGPAWHVLTSNKGNIVRIERKDPWPYVNHYFFHIMDPD